MDNVIGVTTCDHCNSRFRIRESQARFEGRTIRCARCHQQFTVVIQRPSTVEQAAIENSQEEATPRRRRTKKEIRQEHLERIKGSFRTFHPRLTRIQEDERSSEEEVRRWCIDVLRDALGYDDSAIDTEVRVLNRRIDIALKRNEKIFCIIECKNIRSTISQRTLEQAVGYATHLSADWAVTTNGQQWRLHRVLPVKGRDPKVVEIFDIALLDADGMSNQEAESLYLLTARAMLSGDSERMYHRIACTSERRLLHALMSERVTRGIRVQLIESYESEMAERVALEDHHVEERIRQLFLPAEF